MSKHLYSDLSCEGCRYITTCKRLEDATYISDKVRKLTKKVKKLGFKIDISCSDFEPELGAFTVEDIFNTLNSMQKDLVYSLVGTALMESETTRKEEY